MSDMMRPEHEAATTPPGAGHEHGPPQHELAGREVVDEHGERLGVVDGAYVDEDERVLYLSVDSGWYGDERHVVPASGLTIEDDGTLRSRYSRSTIADGPRVSGERGLTIDDLSAVHEHFGLASLDDLLAARQTTPAPTPEIAKAELASAVRQGLDPQSTVFRRWGV